MHYDELAFVNQQLAGMLRAGIPLEGALKRLCQDMRRGGWRNEFEQLQADLGKGLPLGEALAARKLPEFYVRLVQVGVQGQDLPAMLILLADYYQKASLLWTRLKGLMVYPVIVLLASLVLSFGLLLMLGPLSSGLLSLLYSGDPGQALPAITPVPGVAMAMLVLPTVCLGSLAALAGLALLIPRLRRWLVWRLPGFKEARLAHLGASLELLLRGGRSLNEALGLLLALEAGQPLARELAHWRARLAEGRQKFAEVAGGGQLVPPLFVWLVACEAEDWAAGFRRAAEIYYARAVHRAELLLYAALPFSILFVGLVVFSQLYGLVYVVLGGFVNQLGME